MEPRRTMWRAVMGIGVIGAVIAGTAACTSPAQRKLPGRTFIGGVRNDASADSVADERQEREGTSVSWRGRWALRGFVASMTDEDARDLADDPRIAYVEPDITMSTMAQAVPTGIDRIGARANATLR